MFMEFERTAFAGGPAPPCRTSSTLGRGLLGVDLEHTIDTYDRLVRAALSPGDAQPCLG
ncbi:hypothetical protein ACQEVF_56745 [Nonomuraea polychroma]|uniref:hypothetical protein n=1 Tax=Nonomuraea polychroma TaxID=46176 RepID=UPI003D89C7FB